MKGLAMAHWKRHPRRSANRTIVTVIASSLVAMVLLPSPAVAVGPLQDELSDQQALQLDAVELSRDRGISVEAAIQEMLLDRRAYQPGDSGGPWFNGGVPVGIHKGGLCGDYAAWSVYTPISKLSTLSIGVL